MVKPTEVAPLIVKLDEYLCSEDVAAKPLEDALHLLMELNELKKDLAFVYDSFAAKMVDRMQSENSTIVSLDHGVEVKCMTGAPRKKWDNHKLMSDVYNRLQQSSVDMDTGEVKLSTEELVIKLLDYVSPSYWRVKALGEIGINADLYCETGESKTSIGIFGSGKGK